ncbi:hypothetical protein DFH06DRAFT_1151995 [Mycena polygramma]|nr:hypothetical protein DFH06DRAFT_1151995 [Mycena polygramma]
MKVDQLIATMSSTWDSLIAENLIRPPRVPTTITIPSSIPSAAMPTPPASASSSSSSTFAPLTHAEKEVLRAAHGCYHCRKTPQTPGWVKHRSDNCPGDIAAGIPPRSSPAVVAAVGPPGFSSAYEEGYTAVAAVLPEWEDDGNFSSGTDDSDISTRNY